MHATSAAGPALVLPTGVPPWVWIAGGTILALLAAAAFRLLYTANRRRREQRARTAVPHSPGTEPDDTPASQRSERGTQRLVNTAAGICITLYLGLFASSFQAIAGFAREFLRRTGIMVPATPLTLDGVVIGALFLSLAYVAKRKSPAKANALIWGMTIFAAYCGFTYGDSGDHGSLAAGLYYAVMSIVGMLMFHMVLELFQDAGDYIRSKYPSMGWRWITHWSTLPVMLAWINHPPRHQTSDRPTVRQAIDHWNRVRTIRRRADQIEAAMRHELKLAAARRRAELNAARLGAGNSTDRPAAVGNASTPPPYDHLADALSSVPTLEEGTGRPFRRGESLPGLDSPSDVADVRSVAPASARAPYSGVEANEESRPPSSPPAMLNPTASATAITTTADQELQSLPNERTASLPENSARTVAARNPRAHVTEHLAPDDDSESQLSADDRRLPRVREFLRENPRMKLKDVDEKLAEEFRVRPRTVRRLREQLKQNDGVPA